MKLYIYYQPAGANQANKCAEGNGTFDAANTFAVQVTWGGVTKDYHYEFRQGNGTVLGVKQCSGVTLSGIGKVTGATF